MWGTYAARRQSIAQPGDVLPPRWVPTVEAYLKASSVRQSGICPVCVIWLFDAGELIRRWNGLIISQQIHRSVTRYLPTFVSIRCWHGRRKAGRGESIEPYFLPRTFERGRHGATHEHVTAKWYKFAGLEPLRNE